MSLLSFKPMERKVLECSFQSRRLRKTRHLLEILQPKILLVIALYYISFAFPLPREKITNALHIINDTSIYPQPEKKVLDERKSENSFNSLYEFLNQFPGDFKEQINFSSSTSDSFSVLYFTENDTIDVPRMKESFDMEIETESATLFAWKRLKQDDINILENKLASTVQSRSLVNCAMPDLERLLVVAVLSNVGINASIDKPESNAEVECTGVVQVQDPTNAKIEFHSTKIIVTAPDENLAKLISEAITSILDEVEKNDRSSLLSIINHLVL